MQLRPSYRHNRFWNHSEKAWQPRQAIHTITEFKLKVQGASDENPAIPFQAFNGIGDSIVEKYSQGDLVSLFYEPRNEVWETAEGEKRSALRLQVTQIPTTIRRGKKSLEKLELAKVQQTKLAV